MVMVSHHSKKILRQPSRGKFPGSAGEAPGLQQLWSVGKQLLVELVL